VAYISKRVGVRRTTWTAQIRRDFGHIKRTFQEAEELARRREVEGDAVRAVFTPSTKVTLATALDAFAKTEQAKGHDSGRRGYWRRTLNPVALGDVRPARCRVAESVPVDGSASFQALQEARSRQPPAIALRRAWGRRPALSSTSWTLRVPSPSSPH